LDDIADAGKRELANVAAQGESIHLGLRLHGETLKEEMRQKKKDELREKKSKANDECEKKGLFTYVRCRAKAG